MDDTIRATLLQATGYDARLAKIDLPALQRLYTTY